MPPRRSTPPSSSLVEADRNILRAARLLDGYTPHNTTITPDALLDMETRMVHAEEEEFRSGNVYANARRVRVDISWEMHEAALNVKDAVISQFGANSDEVQSLGLKKKIDYRRPRRRDKPEE